MGLKINQRYVIFNGPEQQNARGTRYFSDSGKTTQYRHRAAKFFTASKAIAFAIQKNIKLDGALHYVGIADFTDFELKEGPEF